MINPKETPEDRRKHEVLQSFRRGWKHGACFNAKDRRFSTHTRIDIREAYSRGYISGLDASTLASANEAERLGYDATYSILRGEIPDEPPTEQRTPHPAIDEEKR